MSSQSTNANLLRSNLSIIKSMYIDEGRPANAIASHFNVPVGAVYHILKKEGIQCRNNAIYRRKYDLDEAFFKSIDTKEKAYFLGWLMADGYVNERKHSISIHLQERDRYILDLMKHHVKSDKPLYFVPRRKPQWSDQWDLQMSSASMVDDLKRLGCVQAKSLTLQFPQEYQVPHHLISHLVRGYFDGDGCITLQIADQLQSVCVGFCVSEPFGHGLAEVFRKELGIDCSPVKREHTKIHGIHIGGRNQILRLYEWMYRDSDGLRLERKYVKFAPAAAYVPRYRIGASSKHKGVHWTPRYRKYTVLVCHQGKTLYAGRYTDENEAARAYNRCVIENGLRKPLNNVQSEE